MRKIVDVLRLHTEGGRSHREIARLVSASPTTVGEILRRAKQSGVTYPLPEDVSEIELEAQLYPPAVASSRSRPEPDWATVHREMRRKGVTLDLLWQEHKTEHPNGYTVANPCSFPKLIFLDNMKYEHSTRFAYRRWLPETWIRRYEAGSSFLPLDLICLVGRFLGNFMTLFSCGCASHATPPTLAASRGGHFDAFLAHILENQVNGTDGYGQDDEGDKDCNHDGTRSVVSDGDMLPRPYRLTQRLIEFGFVVGILAMTISTTLSIGLQGIQAGMQWVNIAGSRIAVHAADAELLAANTVEQMSGRHKVELSAQIVKTTDQMLGTLIDLTA
jgi:hypothetical protein